MGSYVADIGGTGASIGTCLLGLMWAGALAQQSQFKGEAKWSSRLHGAEVTPVGSRRGFQKDCA